MANEAEELIPFIQHLAHESEKLILAYYRSHLTIEQKPDESPVTAADKQAEELMRSLIEKDFPQHGIIGEEFGEDRPDAEFTWVLDPIDGTKSFIAGTPLFGTLIALCRNGTPLVGAINMPALHELYIGTSEKTLCNGNQVRMREADSLSDCIVLSTDHYDVCNTRPAVQIDALASKTSFYRTWGDCYGYTLLASGFADIMVDPVLKSWDMMAVLPVIQGAGGKITSLEGGDPLQSNSLLAVHPAYHEEVLAILTGA